MVFRCSQETHFAELQEEKDKKKLLQEELQRIRVQYRHQHQTADEHPSAGAREHSKSSFFKKEYGELQVDHQIAKLQKEMKKLKNIKVSHEALKERYESDLLRIRKQVDTLQHKFEKETKSH